MIELQWQICTASEPSNESVRLSFDMGGGWGTHFFPLLSFIFILYASHLYKCHISSRKCVWPAQVHRNAFQRSPACRFHPSLTWKGAKVPFLSSLRAVGLHPPSLTFPQSFPHSPLIFCIYKNEKPAEGFFKITLNYIFYLFDAFFLIQHLRFRRIIFGVHWPCQRCWCAI